MYPCLRKVQCGYCEKEIIKKNLKKHTKSKHNSLLVKEVPLQNSILRFGGSGSMSSSVPSPFITGGYVDVCMMCCMFECKQTLFNMGYYGNLVLM